jgi:intergrase/recombinase
MNRFAATPVALLVLVLGLVSCGGDGGGDAPSKAEFATQANKICTATEKQLTNLGKAASTDEIADQIDKVIDAMQKSVDQLKDLDRPDGAAGETAEKFVNAVDSDIGDKGIPALEDLRDAIKKKDQQAAQKAYRRLQTVETTTSDKLAQEAGVKGCAG